MRITNGWRFCMTNCFQTSFVYSRSVRLHTGRDSRPASRAKPRAHVDSFLIHGPDDKEVRPDLDPNPAAISPSGYLVISACACCIYSISEILAALICFHFRPMKRQEIGDALLTIRKRQD